MNSLSKYFSNILDNKRSYRGFSLLEVIVTMVIFMIITAISFGSYPKLSVSLGYNATAREILTTIKGVQVSGTSRGGDFVGDGVYFNTSDMTRYNTFLDSADTPDLLGVLKSNKAYVTATSDRLAKTLVLDNFVTFSNFYVKNDADISQTQVNSQLSITFLRPNLTANITNYGNSGAGYRMWDRGYIEMKQPSSNEIRYKCIIVYKFGQIQLKEGQCRSY